MRRLTTGGISEANGGLERASPLGSCKLALDPEPLQTRARDFFSSCTVVHNYSFDIFFFLSEANMFEVLFWPSARVTCPRDTNRDVTEVSFQ
jgi:hypothetical protein